VVIASGSDRVDTSALADVVGAQKVKRADPDDVKSATGYSIGGVSPVGLPGGVEVVIERALAGYPVIWAAAGTAHAVYRTDFDELLTVTGGLVADVRQTS
jgi:prolyl-tRNA editing enzyme YbaK/EbsC (Cys-tRNA(Pro) deacylase)